MHKWLYCFIIFAFIFAGCNNSKETQPANTITFSFPESDQAFYRSLINSFYVQYPGISVILDPVPASRLGDQKGNVQVVSWDIAGEKISWSADNYVDLQDFVSKDGSTKQEDFYSGIILPFTNKGKLVAIPYGMDLDTLNYNLNIFEQQEVAVPNSSWTWDNFLDAAARITGREHEIYGYSASINYIDSLYFLYQNGGSLINDKAEPVLDSESNIEAMGWYGRLFTTLNVAPSSDQAKKSYGYGEDVFALAIKNGKVGMWTGRFSRRDTSTSNGAAAAFETGIVPLPRGVVNFTSGAYEAYAISKNAKNQEACWKLISFLTQKLNPRLIPARISAAESIDYAKLIGAETTAVARASASHIIVVPHDQLESFAKARKAFLQAVPKIINLEMTPKQALEEAQKSILP